jgi:UDP:flavonoid glycosyltransferase YjiC (YdhE family)
LSKIVITTAGSLGDLHPYLAVALGLRERGHEVVVGTSPCYRRKVESLGFPFHPVRPDSDWLADPDRVRRLSHPRWGLLRVGREWLMPALRESYEDTSAAAEGADLLVAMHANYAARLVAEKSAVPWVSAVHIPMGFFSAYDPPLLDFAPALSRRLRFLGPAFWKPLFWFGKRASRSLAEPWYRLRSEIGLPPVREGNPLADSHSPLLVLALFSKLLAERQPDWPPRTVLTGFPFHDDPEALSPPLERFLDAGPPPIVFTLGSAVSTNAGVFFDVSIRCSTLLNRRAVLVVGRGHQGRLPVLPADVTAVEYAPFTELFPRAAAVVHHGGVGTTGQAMRAGRPMLVVPQAWDQADNADRAVRLGVARTVPKGRYAPARAAAELRRLLDAPAYARRASEVSEQIQEEDGVSVACDALEDLLHPPLKRFVRHS